MAANAGASAADSLVPSQRRRYFPSPEPHELLAVVLLNPIELDPEKHEPPDLLPLLIAAARSVLWN